MRGILKKLTGRSGAAPVQRPQAGAARPDEAAASPDGDFSENRIKVMNSALEAALVGGKTADFVRIMDAAIFSFEHGMAVDPRIWTGGRPLLWRCTVLRMLATQLQFALMRLPDLNMAEAGPGRAGGSLPDRIGNVARSIASQTVIASGVDEDPALLLWIAADPNSWRIRSTLAEVFCLLQEVEGLPEGPRRCPALFLETDYADMLLIFAARFPDAVNSGDDAYRDRLFAVMERADAVLEGGLAGVRERPDLYCLNTEQLTEVLSLVAQVLAKTDYRNMQAGQPT